MAILANQRWPATSGASPVVTVPDLEPQPEGVARVAPTTAGPISARRSFPVTHGSAPVFVETVEEPGVVEIDRWLWQYPSQVDRKQLHVSQLPPSPVWNTATPFFDQLSFAALPQLPIWRNGIHPSLVPYTRHNTPFFLQISQAMWGPTYPDQVYGRKPLTISDQAIPATIILPTIAAWSATYADFARTYPPIHHLAPSVFAPDTDRPDLGTPDEDVSWLATYVDFARGRIPLHYLVPHLWWHTETGPDVEEPNRFRHKIRTHIRRARAALHRRGIRIG